MSEMGGCLKFLGEGGLKSSGGEEGSEIFGGGGFVNVQPVRILLECILVVRDNQPWYF